MQQQRTARTPNKRNDRAAVADVFHLVTKAALQPQRRPGAALGHPHPALRTEGVINVDLIGFD